jgi:Flp pilus assembly protein CpaB
MLGVGLSLAAFIAMFAFGIIYAGRQQSGASTRVVVATSDINARTPITPDLLTYATVPNSALVAGTFLQASELTNYFAVVPIYKGEAITPNIVTANPDAITTTSSYLPIPAGYKALTIPTSEEQGVGGFIAQGDYIDVLASVNTVLLSPINPRTVVETVFTQVRVIRVGPQSTVARQGAPQGVATSLTVVMTECDARYMDWLLINATVKYDLLPYKEYGTDTATSGGPCAAIVGPAQIDARWNFTKA